MIWLTTGEWDFQSFLIRQVRCRGVHQLLQRWNSAGLSGQMMRPCFQPENLPVLSCLLLSTFSVWVLKGGQGAAVVECWHAHAVERKGFNEVENSAFLALSKYPTIRHREKLKPFIHLLPFKCLKFKVCVCKTAFFVRFEQRWAQSCPTPAALSLPF